MTNGELLCDRDHDLDEPRTIGYQPLYAATNGRPCFVIVYDYAREQVDKLRFHHLVQVSREKGKSDTVSIVHHKLTAPMYHSTRADLMRPADLTESLLRIWKIPELVAWYRCTQGKGDSAVSPPPPPPPPPKPGKRNRSDGQPFSPMMQSAAARAGIPPEPTNQSGVDEALEELKRKQAEYNSKKNGKH